MIRLSSSLYPILYPRCPDSLNKSFVHADSVNPATLCTQQQPGTEQMDADENVIYWLHDEIEEWNFKAITDETNFYLNEKDNKYSGVVASTSLFTTTS